MRRTLLAAVAAFALAAAPAASADSSPTRAYEGGCSFTYETAGFETYLGEPDPPFITLDAEFVVYSDTEPAGGPVSATVRCELLDFGDVVADASFAGTTAVAGVRTFPKPAGFDPGFIEVCVTVEYDNGESEPRTCWHGDPIQPISGVCWRAQDITGEWLCPPGGRAA